MIVAQPALKLLAEPRPQAVLFVPVLPGPQCLIARMFRDPLGERTAVAFTSADRLTATLGVAHAHTRLCERALRELAALQGITQLTIDPTLAAPAAPATATRRWDDEDWQTRGAASLSSVDDIERVRA